MNLSPEAQAELEREMQKKIRQRKLRRKLAYFYVPFGLCVGIIPILLILFNTTAQNSTTITSWLVVISFLGFSALLVGVLNFMGYDIG